MQRGEAFNQLQERLARFSSSSVSRQQPLRSQTGSQLFLGVPSVSGRIDGILRIFLHPLDRIQRMRPILCRSGRSRSRRPLRRNLLRSQRQRNRSHEKHNRENLKNSSHTRSLLKQPVKWAAGGRGLTPSRPHHRRIKPLGGTVLLQSVTLAVRTGENVASFSKQRFWRSRLRAVKITPGGSRRFLVCPQ